MRSSVYLLMVATISSMMPSFVHNKRFFDVYKEGVDAYLENRWSDCVAYISSSVDLYFETQAASAKCREKCKPKKASKINFKFSDDFENIEFYDKIIKQAFCVVKCKYNENSGYPEPKDVPLTVEQEFEDRLPYDYLQICYFKLGDNQKAANYAYSYLLHQPDNEVMMDNLQFYLTLDDVNQADLINIEEKPYQAMYQQAEQYYQKKQFKKVIEVMNKCPDLYMEAEKECRANCEGPYKPQDHRPEFILAVADQYLYSLKCKRACIDRLSFFNNVNHANILAEMFNYLQFAYFNLGQLEKTCSAVGNYLTLLPSDESMLKNKDYYISKQVCTEHMLQPSKNIVKYAKRNAREKQLMDYINNWNPFVDNQSKREIYKPPSQVLEWSEHEGIQIQMGDEQLNGTRRFVADGFANQQQCSELQQLTQTNSVEGDGYNQTNPHTKNEQFLGLRVHRIYELLKTNVISKAQAELFMDLSEKARIYVEKYFNLNSLYFDFTHLVCRTSLSGDDEEQHPRDDLSHAIHSDNCNVQKDGTCVKAHPAYTWRDYSAILYLNSNFEGGNFFFSDSSFETKAQVNPRCGRLVGFAADNWHGVKAVTKGQRCCLAMWYTLDPVHDEADRVNLYNLIHSTPHT